MFAQDDSDDFDTWCCGDHLHIGIKVSYSVRQRNRETTAPLHEAGAVLRSSPAGAPVVRGAPSVTCANAKSKELINIYRSIIKALEHLLLRGSQCDCEELLFSTRRLMELLDDA